MPFGYLLPGGIIVGFFILAGPTHQVVNNYFKRNGSQGDGTFAQHQNEPWLPPDSLRHRLRVRDERHMLYKRQMEELKKAQAEKHNEAPPPTHENTPAHH